MISDIAQLLTAVTGVCTFLLAVFIAIQASRIHAKTDDLVVHTNSLTDKLMEKTDILARAEGVAEGQAKGTDPLVTQALSDVMAKAVIAAAELAAEKVLAAAALAREVRKES